MTQPARYRMPMQARVLFDWTCRFLLRLACPRPSSKPHARFVAALRGALGKLDLGRSRRAFTRSELRALSTAMTLTQGFALHVPSALARYREAFGLSRNGGGRHPAGRRAV